MGRVVMFFVHWAILSQVDAAAAASEVSAFEDQELKGEYPPCGEQPTGLCMPLKEGKIR